MKVKLGQLVAAAGSPQEPGALQELMEVKGFCVRLAYQLARLAKKVNDELPVFITAKDGLVTKHGTIHKVLDAEGQPTENDEQNPSIRPGEKNWPAFEKDFNTLMAEDVDLDIEPVILPPDAEGVTAGTLLALDGLINVRGEDAPKSGPTGIVE